MGFSSPLDLLYSLLHHRLCGRSSELSISNLRSGDQSQCLLSPLSACDAGTLNLLESLIEGELGSVVHLDISHGVLIGNHQLLVVSTRSLTELVELGLHLKGLKLLLSRRQGLRAGSLVLSGTALGLLLLLLLLLRTVLLGSALS